MLYFLILLILILLFFYKKEYFTDVDQNIYEIDNIFPKIVNKKNAPSDDPNDYCYNDEYIIDPLDIDFRDISKLNTYRPKRIKYNL